MSGWQTQAPCRDQPELFFGQTPREAYAMCARCPVAWECLSFAIDNALFDPDSGIWGGLDPDGRSRFAKQENLGGSRIAARHAHAKHLASLRDEP